MSTTESIIDTSRPSAGRIYDYILGGHHNFEVDRVAAEHIITLVPFLPKFMRMQRWCLQDLAVELTEKRGYDIVIDFASGLPTNDHIHHVVPPGTTVIYSDSDPVVVEYARELLAGTPNVHFFQADARRPEELLNRPAVQDIIGHRRDVALVYWGISGFLSDDALSSAATALYDWSGPESTWAFMAQGGDMDGSQADLQETKRIYEQMGSPIWFRSLSLTKRLIAPWHPDAEDYVSLLDWHGMDKRELDPVEIHSWGPAAGGYGAYLRK